jgi:hypothetical protein
VKRVIPLALALWLTASADDIAILNIRVVEGEGTVYATGSRATRGLTVEVTDESGRPVPDATVSFRLPEDGPSGTFNSGTRTEVVTTRQDGRASVWGMKWNRTPGVVEIRITALKGAVRAGLVSIQNLSDAPAIAHSGPNLYSGRSKSKLLIIGLVVAGAAGGGLAMGMARGAKSSPSVAPTVPLSLGSPSVIVGAP